MVKWARHNRKSIGHIQIAQAPKRTEPHEPGLIDYAKILPFLSEVFPDLYFGLEYKPTSTTEDSVSAGKSVGNIFDYVTV